MTAEKTTIVTYNGIDGACAAAAARLKYPKAALVVSSAARVAAHLEHLSKSSALPVRVLVCGVGIQSDWEKAEAAGLRLKRKGVALTWYCGRGYLESQREDFQRFCDPHFAKLGSNTLAVCRALNVEDHPRARFLIALAEHDPYVNTADHPPGRDEAWWSDRIMAGVSAYLKYQDETAYAAVIDKLARDVRSPDDERAVQVHRRSGFRYVLHGRSPRMRELRQRIDKLGRTEEPVLITGESGVGKEHVAHLLHERSRRAGETIRIINCAIFTGNAPLANSILFGHLKGAFTGATTERAGAFRQADKGTLFLDELGDLPLEVQAKQLRVLEDGEVIPEGADAPAAKVDVRVLAATNRDLPALIRKGAFRADLYHRLSTLRLDVPPLRLHIKDVDAIIQPTLEALAGNGAVRKLTQKEYSAVYGYDWPGNVRQVIKLLKRAVYLEEPLDRLIAEERRLGALTAAPSDADDPDTLLPHTAGDIVPLDDVRSRYAARALELCNDNLTATAQTLGISVNTLRKLVGK